MRNRENRFADPWAIRSPSAPPKVRDHQALRQQQADQPDPTRSHRQPQGDLARSGGGAAQHQVHDVGASDQQHHPGQCHHQEERQGRRRILLDLGLPVRPNFQRAGAIRLRVGLGKLLADNSGLGRGLPNTYPRLKPRVSVRQAAAEASVIGQQLAQAYPATNRTCSLEVGTYWQTQIEQYSVPALAFLLMMALAGVVLLIACANIMNLLLSRASARSREIALRLAVGAGRVRLIRLLLTESLVIALLGGALGLLIAQGCANLFSRFRIPSDMPVVLDFQLTLGRCYSCFWLRRQAPSCLGWPRRSKAPSRTCFRL